MRVLRRFHANRTLNHRMFNSDFDIPTHNLRGEQNTTTNNTRAHFGVLQKLFSTCHRRCASRGGPRPRHRFGLLPEIEPGAT